MSEPKQPVHEFDPMDDEPDDEVQRQRIMQRTFGTVARQVSLDPGDARNRVIADIDKAPRNGSGRVEFSSDIFILRPKAAGNGALLPVRTALHLTDPRPHFWPTRRH